MKRLTPPIVLLVICCVALAVRHGQEFISLPVPFVPQPVTAAIIFYEGKTKHSLSDGVKAVIDTGPKLGVKVLDWNVKDKNKKTPEVLVPFLAVCKDHSNPQLVIRRGPSTYAAQLCPDSPDKLKEALK